MVILSRPVPSGEPEKFHCEVVEPLVLYLRRLRRAPVLQRMPFPLSLVLCRTVELLV